MCKFIGYSRRWNSKRKWRNATLPFPFPPSLPSPFFPTPATIRWTQLEGLWKRCKLLLWGPRQSSGRKRISAYYEVKNRTVFVTNACTKKNQLYRQEVPERGVRSRNERNSVRAQFKLQVYTLITQKRVDYILKLYYRHLRTQLQYKEFFDKITFLWLDSVSSFRLEW